MSGCVWGGGGWEEGCLRWWETLGIFYIFYCWQQSRFFYLAMRSRDRCPYRYNSSWFPRWFKLFLFKISIILTAKFALYELYNNGDIQIKNGWYLQHLDYTHKSQKGHQQTYGVFCGFLEDSSSLSTEKYIVVLKGHVHQKCSWSWGEIKIGYVPSDKWMVGHFENLYLYYSMS